MAKDTLYVGQPCFFRVNQLLYSAFSDLSASLWLALVLFHAFCYIFSETLDGIWPKGHAPERLIVGSE